MKTAIAFLALLCAVAVSTFAGTSSGNGGELVVEPGGLTPHQALLKIRAAKAAGDTGAWTVRVKDGVYVMKEPLVFLPADSGTVKSPVRWIGSGQKAIFAGGDRLTGWKNEGGGVWSSPIPCAPDGKPAYFEQLWVNARRADRARMPNRSEKGGSDEYLTVSDVSLTPTTNAAGKVSYVERVVPTNATLLAAVAVDELPFAQMCVANKWAFSRRILRRVDPVTLMVETHTPEAWKSWKRWSSRETLVWFENVRPGFDAPGEWFYDVKAGKVLYRPLPGEDMARAEVYAPSSVISRLVDFRGEPDKGRYVHDIAFTGITFSYSDSALPEFRNRPSQVYQRQAARGFDGTVSAEGVQRLKFDRCTFSHTGNYGMHFGDGCTSNKIVNCTFFDLGAGGVWMGAEKGHVAKGEKLYRRIIKNLAPRSTAFNRIENCDIRCGGRFNLEGTGVILTHTSDSKVLNCEIHDFYYTGVSVGWTWGFYGSVAQRNEIAFNKIYDLGKGVMSDMGGVYTLGTSYGTRVHHNVIHDVWSYCYGGWALYTDEGSEGVLMDHNLCWNTADGGFHQHFGSGCVIRNNIFAWNRNKGAVRMNRQVVQNIPCTLNFVKNIVLVREGGLVGQGARGVGGIWAGNLWYDCSGGKPDFDGLDWEKWRKCGKEIGGAYADPRFENADNFDFRLKSDSPAFALGFEPWDYSVSGRRKTK